MVWLVLPTTSLAKVMETKINNDNNHALCRSKCGVCLNVGHLFDTEFVILVFQLCFGKIHLGSDVSNALQQ